MRSSLVRTLSFFSKWLAEVVRQPSLMLSLVVGPFLILLAFGQGAKEGAPKPRTIVVVPASSGEQAAIQPVPDDLKQYLTIVGQTSDVEEARKKLTDGEVDLVAILPPDPLSAVERGEHAIVGILIDEIDPVRRSYARAYLRDQIGVLNQQTLNKAIGEAQASTAESQRLIEQARVYVAGLRAARGDLETTRRQVRELRAIVDPLAASSNQASTAAAGAAFVIPGLVAPNSEAGQLTNSLTELQRTLAQIDARLATTTDSSAAPTQAELDRIDANLTQIESVVDKFRTIPSEVLSAPFQLQLDNLTPPVEYISFYAPAVLALLLQHLAITLGALSMARIRLLGLMELLRTSPVRPTEAVVGNYLSYGMLCVFAGALLLVALVVGLGVPVLGGYAAVVGMLLLLVAASLGIGFMISMIASSEQQAAQIAMLILIASVFFSGFIVPLNTIIWPIRAICYFLPATYAIRTLQDVMLRGVLREPADFAILAAAAAAFFLATVMLFRREYAPR